MPTQAMNTLNSLSSRHQHVESHEFEVVVVENRSEHTLSAEHLADIGPNIRYLIREERGESPAAAVNVGAAIARGEYLAVMVDGARMVTPGVVPNILAARTLASTPVVSVPGYHLGQRLHQEAVLHGYTVDQEQEELGRLGWREDGYRLFDMAVPSASCGGGYLQPIAESNCIALPRRLFEELGGFDTGFSTTGGGFVNLDFYRRAVDRGTLVLLPGEGTFHQFHGGATTGAPGVDRDALLDAMRAEYVALRGQVHGPPTQSPILLGKIGPHAMPFLAFSVQRWQEEKTP